MKKRFYLLLILSLLFITGCRNDDNPDPNQNQNPPVEDGGNEDGGNEDGGNEDGGNEDGGKDETNEQITVLKDKDSLELDLEQSIEIDLAQYITYAGTKYAYSIETENKGIAGYEVIGNKLTVVGNKKGIEVVKVKLNDKTIELTITVAGAVTMPEFEDVNVTYDLATESSKEVTLAPTLANGYTTFTYELKETITNVNINGDKLTVAINAETETTIVVVCEFAENEKVEFNVNIKVINSSLDVYKVLNGSFDNDLEGWTLNGEIGTITENATWWGEGLPMFNVGKYFSGYGADGLEPNTGTLTSSKFTLGGTGYITFMLGGAGNENCFITILDNEDNVIAVYRNTEFKDFPQGFVLGEHVEEGKAMVGDTVFMANLVKYKADLSAYIGKELKVVINDNATGGWGLVFFDELSTYHTEVPGDEYVLAVNQLADLTAINELLANEVTEQGDYTLESYNAYKETLSNAKSSITNVLIKQSEVDELITQINDAYNALTLRKIELKESDTELNVIKNTVLTINYNDYFNTNELSNVTFNAKSDKELVKNETSVSFDATDAELEKFTVTIEALYKGEVKQTVELSIEVLAQPDVIVKETTIAQEIDLYNIPTLYEVDLSSNLTIVGGLEVTYLVNEEVLEGSTFTHELTVGVHTFTVLATYEYEGSHEVSYTITLNVSDTTSNRAVNGSFDKDLEGWTLNGEIGAITENSTFWTDFPVNNVGKYLSGDVNGLEPNTGTLSSSTFTLGGTGYITFMLGAAGNENCFITILDKEDNIIAVYRNTQFKDFSSEHADLTTEEKVALIGTKVNAINLIKYKADLSAHIGKELKVVINDNATGGFGFVTFDELSTYYTEIPGDEYVLAVNQLADLTAINELLASEITEQGDYTLESYNLYKNAIDNARTGIKNVYITQTTVDSLAQAITDAHNALVLREIELKEADTMLNVITGNTLVVKYEDYFNTNELSNVTFDATSEKELVKNEDGISFNSTGIELQTFVITLKALYNGEVQKTVTINVTITDDPTPILKLEEIAENIDIYSYTETEYKYDLATNITNSAELELTYYINDIKQESSVYTRDLAVIEEELSVKVEYTIGDEVGSLNYTIYLNIADTTKNRLINGDFETGDLTGWTLVGKLGSVSSNNTYWAEEISYNKDGTYLFDAYADGDEAAVGTLTSSSFVVGGSGYVTFKLGAMKDGNYVYVDVVDANTKEILARYYNGLWADRTDDVLSGCTLIPYKANLSQFEGKEVFFRISDNANSGYGLFFADSFVTYYENEPEGFNDATPVDYQVSGTIYDLFNGGFEMGDNRGWWNDGEIGVVTNASGFWGDNISYNKNGEYLFTGVESYGADTMREGNRGALTSSVFEIGGTGYISFMLGGGGNALCYVQVIDAVTNEILARYHQQAQDNAVLIQYVADLSAYIGRTVRIQVVDQADSGWGCVSFDNVVTYYASEEVIPEGLTATDISSNINYTIENGSFENGDLTGWTMNITEAGSQNTLGWVTDTEIDAGWYTKNDATKDGKYLFTFALPGDINCESSKGTLQSSTFSLKQNSYVSFKFGAAGGAQNHDVYIELCRADGSVIATFYNDAEGKVNTLMNSYYYQYKGVTTECFFRVVDNSTGDYGCLVIDDFRVNLEAAPEGFIQAIQ